MPARTNIYVFSPIGTRSNLKTAIRIHMQGGRFLSRALPCPRVGTVCWCQRRLKLTLERRGHRGQPIALFARASRARPFVDAVYPAPFDERDAAGVDDFLGNIEHHGRAFGQAKSIHARVADTRTPGATSLPPAAIVTRSKQRFSILCGAHTT